MWKFFSFLTTNWIGLLIGLGVAIIICLILGLTVLKSNVLARSIIFIIVTIIFTLSGAAIQQKFFINQFRIQNLIQILMMVLLNI